MDGQSQKMTVAARGCFQTNANQSLVEQQCCPLCRAKNALLGKGGRAVPLEGLSEEKAAFPIEEV